jgi:hypothetical protein
MSTGNIDPQALNRMFTSQLDTNDGIEKAAQAGQSFIRSKIREEAFVRKILPPQRVTEDDLQRAVDHDTLVKIIDIEHDSTAMPITFRGTPTINYIQGQRAEVKFYTISSEKFEKTEQELRAYEYPIQKVIENNTVKDIEKVEDGRFIQHVNEILDVTNKEVGATEDYVTKELLRDTFNLLDGDKLRANMILMSDTTFNSINAWDNTLLGDEMLGEVTREGYDYDVLQGRQLVTTNKTDIVDEGEIYCFTQPEYLGVFYTLNEVNFWVEKEANIIRWQSWEDIGSAIINTRSVAKGTYGLPASDPRV